MKKEVAVGLVIVSKEKPKKYLLLKYNVHGKTHWDFVKGKIERNESIKNAIKRELKEETKIIRFEYVSNSKFIKTYTYKKNDGVIVNKKVTYFPIRISIKERVIISKEHSKFGWFSLKKTKKILKYKGQKEVLSKFI